MSIEMHNFHSRPVSALKGAITIGGFVIMTIITANDDRYIGLHSLDASIGTGHDKYGEYQYVCTPAQIATFDCFSDISMYQLFDLTKDPYELYNVHRHGASRPSASLPVPG